MAQTDAMKLSEFVEKTLTQICEGVAAAGAAAAAHGGQVNPHPSTLGDRATKLTSGEWAGEYVNALVPIIRVKFDVALTVVDEAGTGGGVKVLGGFVSAGAGGGTRNTETSASRIAFEVPLALPRPPGGER